MLREERKQGSNEHGIGMIEAVILLPLFLLLILGGIDYMFLLTKRFAVVETVANLNRLYQTNPAAVDLEAFKASAGLGVVDFSQNTDKSCILVTAYKTLEEAEKAAKTQSCSNYSASHEISASNPYSSEKPYLAISADYEYEYFSPLLKGINSGKSVRNAQVVQEYIIPEIGDPVYAKKLEAWNQHVPKRGWEDWNNMIENFIGTHLNYQTDHSKNSWRYNCKSVNGALPPSASGPSQNAITWEYCGRFDCIMQTGVNPFMTRLQDMCPENNGNPDCNAGRFYIQFVCLNISKS